MIYKKKEGDFYASKVRLFLNEYDGIPLEEFCKAEKVSYSKMLNCLGRTNHQYYPVSKPKSDKPIKAAIERTQNHACMSYAEREQARVNLKAVSPDKPLLPSLELKELVVNQPDGKGKNEEELSRVTLISGKSKPTKVSRLIENINISINDRIGVSIGRCDVSTLSALIREMEVSR